MKSMGTHYGFERITKYHPYFHRGEGGAPSAQLQYTRPGFTKDTDIKTIYPKNESRKTPVNEPQHVQQNQQQGQNQQGQNQHEQNQHEQNQQQDHQLSLHISPFLHFQQSFVPVFIQSPMPQLDEMQVQYLPDPQLQLQQQSHPVEKAEPSQNSYLDDFPRFDAVQSETSHVQTENESGRKRARSMDETYNLIKTVETDNLKRRISHEMFTDEDVPPQHLQNADEIAIEAFLDAGLESPPEGLKFYGFSTQNDTN